MINYLFMGKVQCELQLSIQESKGKEKNYYIPYIHSQKKLILLAVAFDVEVKNIGEYLVEEVNTK